VPVFATWKSHPTKDSEFLAWYQRVELARAVYENPDPMRQKEFKKLCEDYGITHAVWPAAKGDFPYAGRGERVYGDDSYSVWTTAPR
jgi:hypothetical protein